MVVLTQITHRPVWLTAIGGMDAAMQSVTKIAAPTADRTPTCTQSTGLTKSANGSLVEKWFADNEPVVPTRTRSSRRVNAREVSG